MTTSPGPNSILVGSPPNQIDLVQLNNTVNALSQAVKALPVLIWGYIDSDGTIISGSGNFTVTVEPNFKASMDITFQTPFAATPIVTVGGFAAFGPALSSIAQAPKIYGAAGLFVASILYVDKTVCRIQAGQTGPGNTQPSAAPFCFIACGSSS